ncbi:unnamed protein product [Penicillium salamii]|uniref:Mitochondrial thiamine pyrophosphate carrier 1 n=1 Tax=Penicillium salamii TaxID=1612424 RepID=A0A9W4JRZ8_9EURO|nr:unnamed protein product [Penicillium salamii]CAG8098122.1 unnamed protein product [Penicillium salamii]CAG8124422.1 unnamed protein product [Penicillium salamii]CAG8131521.1 unnamed protein product [Penicillium salamii]CAG8154132.1 unnamed protein product [Penicillium salamii]
MYNSNTDIWVAGAFAAVAVDFMVYPVDTLKTRIQSPDYSTVFKDAPGSFFTTYEAVKSILYNSSTQDSNKDFRERSLSKIHLPFTHSLPTPVMHGIASSTGEMVSCLVITPTEVLKQNAQMINGKQGSPNATRVVLSRFRRHPWRLWSGYTALLGRNLPTTALQFPLFEYIRSNMIKMWRKRNGKDESAYSQSDLLIERAGLTGISAAMSGTVVSTVTTPIDVVKTRIMLLAGAGDWDGGKESSGSKQAAHPRKGPLAVGRDILRNEGVKGLFRGGLIRAGWTAVALGLYLSLYESGRFYLENRRREKDGLAQKSAGEGDEV